MNKTIEISTQAATDLLPCLESKLQNLDNHIHGLTQEYNTTKATIAEIRAKLDNQELPLKNGKLPKRLPKGYGDKLIVDILKSVPPGHGLTMAEIATKTGVKQPTVYRTLTDAKRNKGRFEVSGNVWKLKL